MTALYHAGARAKRTALMLRLDILDYYNEEEQHTRGSHGIGALLLANILEEPAKWPSVHWPPAVPKQQPELNTIVYAYEHWDPKWSVEECRALQELVGAFIEKSGEKALRNKGVFPLPNKTSFSLMAAQDRDYQQKRDEWVS